jgi:CelD/BcsL family acetyltransferase involved in cellulose biosynthesis
MAQLKRVSGAAAHPMPHGFELETFANPSDIEQEWRELEERGVATIFQRYDWVEAYVTHVLPHEKSRPAIVLSRLEGRPAFILPLAISRVGPLRMATWIGGRHSGYNFGLWSAQAITAIAAMTRIDIERMLASALHDTDCAVLARTPRSHDGVAQPLAVLPSSRSSTEGYAFDLEGGFEAVLKRTNGGGRRRGIKTKESRMAKAGTLHYGEAGDITRAKAALAFFFEQKALRLAEQGKSNGFEEPGVKAFFGELLERSQGKDEPLLEMTELSVDGKIRAVRGAGTYRGRLNGYFMTFARDDMAAHSPGHVLLFRHIEACCKRALAVYDCGVGYEDYKMSWCDIIIELDDAYAAFTPLGAAVIGAVRLSNLAKARVRQNDAVWRHLKSARALASPYLAAFRARFR